MQLVIFDVDGTLTDTDDVDRICFQLALKQEFGLLELSCNWEIYTYTTDQGIATEVLTSLLNRAPFPSELERVRTRFLSELNHAFHKNPNDFRAIPGATGVLQHLQEETVWKVAIATGCWADSAFFKLRQAEIQFKFPFASCEDSISRDEIVHCAIEKAKIYYDCNNISSVVYVGDGVWDVATARNLGIGFVGVSSDENRSRLKAAGAKFICRDFDQTRSFLSYLNHFNCYESSN